MKPHIFAAGDLNYCEQYGPALKASAQEHGLTCEIVCNGERVVNDRQRRQANAFRYILLPDVLKENPNVLMLDLDCIIKRPVEIADDVRLGFVFRDDTEEKFKKVNGGCIYITDGMMDVALELQQEMRDFPIWYYDQMVLWRISERLKGIVTPLDFFSWRFRSAAAIWTGKGKIKNTLIWEAESKKYEHLSLDWV